MASLHGHPTRSTGVGLCPRPPTHHARWLVILCHDITFTQSNLNTLHVVSTVLAVRVNGHAVVGGVEQFLVRHVHRAVLGQVEGVGAGGSAGQAVALAHGLHKDAARLLNDWL